MEKKSPWFWSLPLLWSKYLHQSELMVFPTRNSPRVKLPCLRHNLPQEPFHLEQQALFSYNPGQQPRACNSVIVGEPAILRSLLKCRNPSKLGKQPSLESQCPSSQKRQSTKQARDAGCFSDAKLGITRAFHFHYRRKEEL